MNSVDPNKKKKNQLSSPNEILREFSNEILSVPKGIFEEAGRQLGVQPLSGEIKLGGGTHQAAEQAASVENQTKVMEAKFRQFQQVQRNEGEARNFKQKAIEEQVAKLMQELQVEVAKLQEKTAELGSDVKKITVETKPAKSGIYHLNFFDMMITMLRELRQKVGESRMWLNKSMQKKKQKGYWAMFKKHGMNFAASDERAVASSNG